MTNSHPWPMSARILRLGSIEIDLRYRTVSQDGIVTDLNPRSFDLLLLFLSERGTLQTRDAIFRKVWPGVVVEDSTLTSSIWMLRRAFGADNKHWFRTVAKQGYVFDPPATIDIVDISASERVETTAEPMDASRIPAAPNAPVAATAQQPWYRPRNWPGAAAVLLVTALTIAAIVFAVLPQRETRVELVVQPTHRGASEPDWPAQALGSWIEWQLQNFDDVHLVSKTDICKDCTSLIALISVERLGAGKEGVWRLSVRFRGERAPADVVRESTDERVVQMLDEVARDTITSLAPSSRQASMPALQLDLATLETWMEGLDAERERRWGDAAASYARVVEKAPEFGYARIQLARMLMESRQVAKAAAAADKASGWITALPEPLQRPLTADLLFVHQDYAAAADAYANLARRNDSRRDEYLIAEARSLRLDGRTMDAAARLAKDLPRPRPLALRWLIEHAETDMANRDVARVVDTVTVATQLANDLGLPQAVAHLTLLRAEAQAAQAKPLENTEFGRIADTLERGGNTLEALRARAYGELISATPAGPGKPTETYMANARMAGNASLEIDALRRTAQFRFRQGDADGAHTAYAQAGNVAQSVSGNRRDRQLVELDLIQEDTLRLDFASIDLRLATLRAQPLQGRVAVLTGQHTARLAYWRGNFTGALALIDETTQRHGDKASGNLAQVTSTLGCLRGAIFTARGETAAARNAASDCRASGMPLNQRLADAIEMELAILTGDREQARQQVAPLLSDLNSERNRVFRWAQIQEIAPLLVRLGDERAAASLLDEAIPGTQEAGYTSLESDMRLTRAQIALTQSDLDRAARELARADEIVPRDYWYERRRLRIVQAVLLQARGDANAATAEIDRVHADAVNLNDVVAELQVHSLLDTAHLHAICSRERHERLLALSGMRGATDAWMIEKIGHPIGTTPAH